MKVLEIAAHKLAQVLTALLVSEAGHERDGLSWRTEAHRLASVARVLEHKHAVLQACIALHCHTSTVLQSEHEL